jgi:tetratricopeptide (TPR) repeat protein
VRGKVGRVSEETELKRALLAADRDAETALALNKKGRYEEAIAVLDASIARFADAPAPQLREQVALALRNKIGTLELARLEESSPIVDEDRLTSAGEEALAMLDELARGYSQTDRVEVRDALVVMLYVRAGVLRTIDRRDEAIRTLNDLITRFEADEDEDVRVNVQSARLERELIVGERLPGGADLPPELQIQAARERLFGLRY